MLGRVSALSESLREEVSSLRNPLFNIPLLHIVHKLLLIYGLCHILVVIQHILSSNVSVEISDDTTLAIDHWLDDFLIQFQKALDLLEVPAGQPSSPNSTHSDLFRDSHHFTISGGNFSATTISNPVVHDSVVREQIQKILQIVYIQCVVLFS